MLAPGHIIILKSISHSFLSLNKLPSDSSSHSSFLLQYIQSRQTQVPVHLKFQGKSKATKIMNKTLKLVFLSKQLLLVLTVVQMHSIKRNQWDQEGDRTLVWTTQSNQEPFPCPFFPEIEGHLDQLIICSIFYG